MHLVRYAELSDPAPRVGVADAAGVHPVEAAGVAELVAGGPQRFRQRLDAAAGGPAGPDPVVFLPPVDGRMEVWAAGVTYFRSRDARMEESATADVYALVYDADRPELFFKAAPWRTVTHTETVAVRRDSRLDVPEPELAVLVDPSGEILAYGVCNDLSSRQIEGDNPLYLPQAKIYAGSCALSAGWRPAWEIADPADLGITMTIERAGAVVWKGESSTSALRRTPAELAAYLVREEQFPHGAVISTGTGIVPEMEFTLAAGDLVTIAIEELGVLANPVVAGRDELAWLVDALEDPSRRNAARGGPLVARTL